MNKSGKCDDIAMEALPEPNVAGIKATEQIKAYLL